MRALTGPEIGALRSELLARIGFLSRSEQGNVMRAFDAAVEEFNRAALAEERERDVSVRCALCARPSVRGQYRLLTGRRVWVCLNCSTGCSRIEGPGICSDCLQNGR